jgi:hypothetical protein
VQAYQSRFDTLPPYRAVNPKFPDVIKCEFLDFKLVDSDSGVTGEEMVQFKADKQGRINAPDFVKSWMGTDRVCFNVKLTIDRPKRRMNVVTENVTFCNSGLRLKEDLWYKEHPEDPSKMLLTCDAELDLMYIPGVSHSLESFVLEVYAEKTAQARKFEMPFIAMWKGNENLPARTWYEDKVGTVVHFWSWFLMCPLN